MKHDLYKNALVVHFVQALHVDHENWHAKLKFSSDKGEFAAS